MAEIEDFIETAIDPIDLRMMSFYGSILSALALKYVFVKELLPTVVSGNNLVFIAFIIAFAGFASYWARHHTFSWAFRKYTIFTAAIATKIFLIFYILVRLSLTHPEVMGHQLFSISTASIVGLMELAAMAAAIYTIRWFGMERIITSGKVYRRLH